MSKKNSPSIKLNFVLSTAYQIMIFILPLITKPYFSRVLRPEGLGIYSYTQSYQTYFSMFAALGTMSYGTREISRARDDMERRSRLFWEIELMTVITSTVCLGAWILFILLNEEYRIYYIVLTMGILSTMFDISWFFNGLEQFKYTVSKNAFFKIAGVILLFIFVRTKEDLPIYAAILIGSTMLGNLSMWLYVGRFTTRVDFRKLKILPHFKETLIYFVPSIATSVYTVLDKTLIGLLTGNRAQNGFYEQTTEMVNMMKALTFTSLNNVLGARISYLFENKKYGEIKERIRLSVNYILYLGLGMCFGLMAVSSRFVPWFYGPGYDEVATMLKLMSPIVVIIGVSNCLGSQYYTPSGKRKLSAKFIVAGACTNLVMNLILIPRLLGNGAIVASLAAELLITVLYLRHCDGYLTPAQLWQDGWKKLLAGIVMMGCILVIDPMIASNKVAVLVEVPLGVMVYFGLTWLLKDRFLMEFILGRMLKGIISKLKRR
ncbi:MAG: flippase [bacterium]